MEYEDAGTPVQGSLSPRFPTWLRALVEILIVATVGDFVFVPLFLVATGIDPHQVFADSWTLALVLVTKATVTILTILALLRLNFETVQSLGGWRRFHGREVLEGALWLPLLFGVVAGFSWLFEVFLPQYVSEANPLLEMLKSPGDLVAFLVTSVFVGGFQEELQRAFVLNRFQRSLGGAVLGLVLWSSFFGIGHAVQGFDNAVKAGFLGLLFGILYLRRRNLTAPVVSHALFDVLTVLITWLFLQSDV